MAGTEASVSVTFFGLDVDAAGGEFYACELAMGMMGVEIEAEDRVLQIKAVIIAADFCELTRGAQIMFT